MKQRYLWMMVIMFSFSSCGTSNVENPLPDEEEDGSTSTTKTQKISYADPTILLDNGTYYMSGTSQISNQSSRGFTILMSDDLQEWTTGTTDTYRFILGPEWGTTYGTAGFWAPQWYKENGMYYFLYLSLIHI